MEKFTNPEKNCNQNQQFQRINIEQILRKYSKPDSTPAYQPKHPYQTATHFDNLSFNQTPFSNLSKQQTNQKYSHSFSTTSSHNNFNGHNLLTSNFTPSQVSNYEFLGRNLKNDTTERNKSNDLPKSSILSNKNELDFLKNNSNNVKLNDYNSYLPFSASPPSFNSQMKNFPNFRQNLFEKYAQIRNPNPTTSEYFQSIKDRNTSESWKQANYLDKFNKTQSYGSNNHFQNSQLNKKNQKSQSFVPSHDLMKIFYRDSNRPPSNHFAQPFKKILPFQEKQPSDPRQDQYSEKLHYLSNDFLSFQDSKPALIEPKQNYLQQHSYFINPVSSRTNYGFNYFDKIAQHQKQNQGLASSNIYGNLRAPSSLGVKPNAEGFIPLHKTKQQQEHETCDINSIQLQEKKVYNRLEITGNLKNGRKEDFQANDICGWRNSIMYDIKTNDDKRSQYFWEKWC